MGEAITRHSLRPLISEGDGYCKTRADPAAGMLNHILSAVMLREAGEAGDDVELLFEN